MMWPGDQGVIVQSLEHIRDEGLYSTPLPLPFTVKCDKQMLMILVSLWNVMSSYLCCLHAVPLFSAASRCCAGELLRNSGNKGRHQLNPLFIPLPAAIILWDQCSLIQSVHTFLNRFDNRENSTLKVLYPESASLRFCLITGKMK